MPRRAGGRRRYATSPPLHPDGRVLVVAHDTFIRLVLCGFLGIPLGSYRTVFPAVRNGALTELGVDGPTVSLLQYNALLSS